jgi:hypothetical protein
MDILSEQLAQLPSLNSLYAKMHIRKLRLSQLRELVLGTNELAEEFGSSVIEREKILIDEVEQEIEDTLAKVKDAALACNQRISQKLGVKI